MRCRAPIAPGGPDASARPSPRVEDASVADAAVEASAACGPTRVTRVAEREASLGDGSLMLAPNERFAVMTPGPFDGFWGHVETKRKTVDKVAWDDAGRVTVTRLAEAQATAADAHVCDEVVVIARGRHVVVRRSCDDATLFDDPAALPRVPGASPLQLSPSGKYLLFPGDVRSTIFRIE